MAAAMFAYFFFSALYLQLVLELLPDGGRARVPARHRDLGRIVAVLSPRLVMRYGIKPPLAAGLGLMALGLLLYAHGRLSTATARSTSCPRRSRSGSEPGSRSTPSSSLR